MPEAVRNATQEFWHSPAERSVPFQPAGGSAPACPECAAEYVPGAAFCHSCGETRDRVTFSPGWLGRFEISSLQGMFGLTLAPLVAFFLGVICAVAALLSGVFSNPQTILDWQVVQSWRIEWLLASVASFVAGILLKCSPSR